MDDLDVRRHWDGNAETWTELSRASYDRYRDLLNTPAFLAMLPDVAGADGLDLGCGEGHNTRLLAERGARMTAVDFAGRFVVAAAAEERRRPLGIRYVQADAAVLPFRAEAFGFAVAFMSLMDMADLGAVLAEARRVLRPGGFLQFSIEHPCTATPGSRWIVDDRGRRVARTIGGYFDQVPHVDTWTFGAAPETLRSARPPFRTPRFPRTLSGWLNTLIAAGMTIEAVGEPVADDATVAREPRMARTRVAPLFLHVRCRV